jgi:hypothetical protein
VHQSFAALEQLAQYETVRGHHQRSPINVGAKPRRSRGASPSLRSVPWLWNDRLGASAAGLPGLTGASGTTFNLSRLGLHCEHGERNARRERCSGWLTGSSVGLLTLVAATAKITQRSRRPPKTPSIVSVGRHGGLLADALTSAWIPHGVCAQQNGVHASAYNKQCLGDSHNLLHLAGNGCACGSRVYESS